MSGEVVMEDYMLEEVETWRYYLSKEEFVESMFNFDEHKSRYEALLKLEKPSEKPIKKVVYNFFNDDDDASTSGLTHQESQDLSRMKEVALCSIADYFAKRNLKRKAVFAGIGNDEDHIQCSKKQKVIKDSKFEKFVDVCTSTSTNQSIEVKPIRRLKVISSVSGTKSSRKRAVTKKSCKKKGSVKKVVYDVPEVRELPSEYLDRIQELNGRNVQLIAQKALTVSDVNRNLNRLLLNQTSLVRNDFLNKKEEAKILKEEEYVRAKLLEPLNCSGVISINKWHMEKNSYYALLKPWREVVADNGFAANDVVQVWSFRFDDGEELDQLGVAVVRIFKAPTEESSAGGSSSGGGSVCSS